MSKLLPVIIICGVGIVASVTYIICLIAHERKQTKTAKSETILELIDDDTLVIPYNKK